ncbi:MAG: hypothetical protein QME71_03175 [Dehalococcoidia bacterium]|nr:hypothetical protein [Dehalococcoidia bacterium]
MIRPPAIRGGIRGGQAFGAVADSGRRTLSRQEDPTRLGHRRPGTSIAFIDAPTGEVILNIGIDEDGGSRVFFHLYDSAGRPVADSGNAVPFPDGLTVCCSHGELLLKLPADLDGHICYRLYTSGGDLLGQSDGIHTTVGPRLKMEARAWCGQVRPPPRQRRRP